MYNLIGLYLHRFRHIHHSESECAGGGNSQAGLNNRIIPMLQKEKKIDAVKYNESRKVCSCVSCHQPCSSSSSLTRQPPQGPAAASSTCTRCALTMWQHTCRRSNRDWRSSSSRGQRHRAPTAPRRPGRRLSRLPEHTLWNRVAVVSFLFDVLNDEPELNVCSDEARGGHALTHGLMDFYVKLQCLEDFF